MSNLLVIDEPRERVEEWRAPLESAGYRIVMAVPDDEAEVRMPATAPDVIVLAAPTPECRAWDVLAQLRVAGAELGDVPVVLVVGPGAVEDALRGAIEGAVRCLAEPVDVPVLVAALAAVLAPGAPPRLEQRRYARQRALVMLARIEARGAALEDDAHPRLVHLTRLEHGPIRYAEPEPVTDTRRRLATLTTKQRALLELVGSEGGVTAAAARLETSRGNVYAGLRRIVHRLGMRDTNELLRRIGSGGRMYPPRP